AWCPPATCLRLEWVRRSTGSFHPAVLRLPPARRSRRGPVRGIPNFLSVTLRLLLPTVLFVIVQFWWLSGPGLRVRTVVPAPGPSNRSPGESATFVDRRPAGIAERQHGGCQLRDHADDGRDNCGWDTGGPR